MSSNHFEQYEGWLVIAVKTDTRLATYSFILICPQKQLYQIDEDEFASIESAIKVGKKFIDLEEARSLAKKKTGASHE